MWGFAREERGVAYLSVILLTTLLFAWVTFQLERVVQHHQTVHDDTAMIQAQYAAESGIEYMRSILRDQGDVDPLTVTLQTGEAAVEVVRRIPSASGLSVGRSQRSADGDRRTRPRHVRGGQVDETDRVRIGKVFGKIGYKCVTWAATRPVGRRSNDVCMRNSAPSSYWL